MGFDVIIFSPTSWRYASSVTGFHKRTKGVLLSRAAERGSEEISALVVARDPTMPPAASHQRTWFVIIIALIQCVCGGNKDRLPKIVVPALAVRRLRKRLLLRAGL